MRMYLFKREIVLLSVILLISAVLIFPPDAYSAGTIQLNKGAVLELQVADSATKGGGLANMPEQIVSYTGSQVSSADKSSKTLSASTTSEIGRYNSWAKLQSQFTVARGNNGQTFGKARITIDGGHYKGSLEKLCLACFASVQLKMNVSDQDKSTNEEKVILSHELAMIGSKDFNSNFSKSIEVTVIYGKTYFVDLYLETAARGVALMGYARADFSGDDNKVTYEKVKVEILESGMPASGPGRYR